MAVKNLQGITPIYWVPPNVTANWRVTVERSDGTIDDITDIILNMKIEDGVTEGIGNFEFEIPNPNETYTDVWTGMEIFRYYADYTAGTPSTLRFRGRIEKPSNENNNMRCTGRSESLFVHEQNVSKDYVDQDAGYAIKDLFDTYGESRFDTSGISTSIGINITLPFIDVPFWSAIESICLSVGYDCYVDCNLVVQFFEAGTKLNSDEGIVHDYNLVNVGDFAPDLTLSKNQIRVIGGVIDGVRVFYTVNDSASQSTNGIRRKIINDDGITTIDAAKDLAEFVLAEEKDAPTVGEIKGLHLATIQPGENIRLSSPMENIPPADYRTILYKLEVTDGMGYTTVTINKQPRRLSNILKDRIQRDNKKTGSSINLYDLDFCEIETFNADTGTHSDTIISDGILKILGGTGIGTWTSDIYATHTDENVSQLKVNLIGDNLTGATIEVSVDNGYTYETVNRDELITITNTGKGIMLKLTLVGESTQIDSYSIQYSTE